MIDEASPITVGELLDGEDPPLVADVSTEAELAFGHVPGSINVPLSNLVPYLGHVADTERTVTVCLRDEASVQVIRLLSAYEGIENARIQSMAGGLAVWDSPLEEGFDEGAEGDEEDGDEKNWTASLGGDATGNANGRRIGGLTARAR